jgi:hypothetical protein
MRRLQLGVLVTEVVALALVAASVSPARAVAAGGGAIRGRVEFLR